MKYGVSSEEFWFGLLLTVIGLISYVLVPRAMINKEDGKATFYLLTIMMALIVGSITLVSLLLPKLTELVVHAHCYIESRLIFNKEVEKLKPIIFLNLKANSAKNQKTGMITITTVMFLIFVKTFTQQLDELFQHQLQRALGGDMIIWQTNEYSKQQTAERSESNQAY